MTMGFITDINYLYILTVYKDVIVRYRLFSSLGKFIVCYLQNTHQSYLTFAILFPGLMTEYTEINLIMHRTKKKTCI